MSHFCWFQETDFEVTDLPVPSRHHFRENGADANNDETFLRGVMTGSSGGAMTDGS